MNMKIRYVVTGLACKIVRKVLFSVKRMNTSKSYSGCTLIFLKFLAEGVTGED
jgi:hypothetical protein